MTGSGRTEHPGPFQFLVYTLSSDGLFLLCLHLPPSSWVVGGSKLKWPQDSPPLNILYVFFHLSGGETVNMIGYHSKIKLPFLTKVRDFSDVIMVPNPIVDYELTTKEFILDGFGQIK